MRLVKHPAVDTQSAEIRIACEGFDYFLCPCAFRRGRLESGIDDIDMLGMNDGLCGKAIPARDARFQFEPGKIFDVGVNGVDRCDLGSRSADEAHAARKPVRSEEHTSELQS